MRRWLVHVAGLTAVWVLLWGRLSVANVLSGAVVAAVLLAVFPLERADRTAGVVVRPVGVARLVGRVTLQLVTSNATMIARVVAGPADVTGTVVRCPLRTSSDGVVTAVTSVLALSPGTMVVDVERGDDGVVLLVHALGDDAAEVVPAEVARLESLVVDAVGSPAEVAACARSGERSS